MTECEPALLKAAEHVACPGPATGTAEQPEIATPSELNATLPPPGLAVTDAVSVTASPVFDGFRDDDSAVLVRRGESGVGVGGGAVPRRIQSTGCSSMPFEAMPDWLCSSSKNARP